MNNNRLTEGHEHDHATEEEAVACAIQAITNGIGHGVHSSYPEAETDPAVALAIAAALLTLSAKYATYAGHHPIVWLKQQVDVNEKFAQAHNASNN